MLPSNPTSKTISHTSTGFVSLLERLQTLPSLNLLLLLLLQLQVLLLLIVLLPIA